MDNAFTELGPYDPTIKYYVWAEGANKFLRNFSPFLFRPAGRKRKGENQALTQFSLHSHRLRRLDHLIAPIAAPRSPRPVAPPIARALLPPPIALPNPP